MNSDGFAQPQESAQPGATLLPSPTPHPYRGVVGQGGNGMSAQPAQPCPTTWLGSWATLRTNGDPTPHLAPFAATRSPQDGTGRPGPANCENPGRQQVAINNDLATPRRPNDEAQK
jgi:hypothetical protein